MDRFIDVITCILLVVIVVVLIVFCEPICKGQNQEQNTMPKITIEQSNNTNIQNNNVNQ